MSKESGRKSFFRSNLFVAAATTVAVMAMFGYGRAYYQNYLVAQEIRYLQDQAEKLEAKKIELLDVLKYVKSDSFAEEKARMELNMAKPGERVLVVPRTEVAVNRQENGVVVGLNNVSNYKKWRQLFLNK
jgi:cell division protein FtsB